MDRIQHSLQRIHFWSQFVLLSSYNKFLLLPEDEFEANVETNRIRYKIALDQFSVAQKEYDLYDYQRTSVN